MENMSISVCVMNCAYMYSCTNAAVTREQLGAETLWSRGASTSFFNNVKRGDKTNLCSAFHLARLCQTKKYFCFKSRRQTETQPWYHVEMFGSHPPWGSSPPR